MRLVLIVLLVVVFVTKALASDAHCKSTCVPPSLSKMPEDVMVYRQKTFACLFVHADADKNGKIDYKEYMAWRSKHIPWHYKLATVWTAVTFMCNCDCDDSTISWEDINGSSSTCLHDLKTTDFAYNMLCK
jgi:hypothetical protein